MPPPAELRKRPQDGISRVKKVAVVELGFRGAPGCLGVTWIYIGGRSRSVEQRGAHEGGGRAQGVGAPPASWPPRLFLDVHSKSSGSGTAKSSSVGNLTGGLCKISKKVLGQCPLRRSAGKGPKMGSYGYRRLQPWK